MKYIPIRIVLLLLPLLLGCRGEDRVLDRPSKSVPSRPTAGARFDPATTGTIRGRVVWSGEIPFVPGEIAGVPNGSGYDRIEVPNPWAPSIDRKTHGLADAMLSIDGIDPETAKPWDLGPVQIEIEERRLSIRQGESAHRRTGFVRPGDEVVFISQTSQHQMLRARGAAFFTLPFPEPKKPRTRRLEVPGWVELSSGTGFYWHSAEIHVASNPYQTLSGFNGEFVLTEVPPGSYSLVARVRNWHVIAKERDPETGLVFRQSFAAAVEIRVPLTVQPKLPSEITINVPASSLSDR